ITKTLVAILLSMHPALSLAQTVTVEATPTFALSDAPNLRSLSLPTLFVNKESMELHGSFSLIAPEGVSIESAIEENSLAQISFI
ncbi:MAG: hypothetical protein AB8B95_00915, partial [Pseudohongiellaceae bacterium]